MPIRSSNPAVRQHVSFDLMYDQLLLLEQLGLIPAQQPAG